MTWTKVPDTFHDDPTRLKLPRDARLLEVEGLSYCNRHLTDGEIPTAALTRLTDSPTPAESPALLVEAGLWRATSTGWEIVHFLRDQQSKEEVEKGRELKAARQDRWRHHQRGDHSRCLPRYCRDASTDAPTDGSRDASVGGPPTRPVPTRPVPSSSEGAGSGSGRARPFGLTASVVPPVPLEANHKLAPLLPMEVYIREPEGDLDNDDVWPDEPSRGRPW